MIGLDAADPVLVDRWIDDGSLPHLGALKTGGVHGRLQTSATHLAGSPWPTFYTGQPPCHHGIYHDFQWRHEQMKYARPHFDWLPASPFWRSLDSGVKVVAYDVPMTLNCAGATGIEVTGWASHDSLGPPATHPPKLITEIKKRFGGWLVTPEAFGRSSVSELLALRDELQENTRRSLELATWLLQRPWDLGIVVFSALHRGGHRLWDRSSIEGNVGNDEGQAFDRALRELYIACDRAVGELVSLAGEATVIVFSLHGMMVNTTRVDLLDEMLARALHGPEGRVGKRGFTRRLGEAVPLGLRRLLTRSVPDGLRNLMMTLWSTGGTKWNATEAFTLRADLQGYVRVNLQGREPRGTVPPGDFDALCDRITEGLCSFRDASSGESIVEEVRRTRDLFKNGPRSDRLPDLVVRWKETPAAVHHALVSDRLGRIERATPGRIPNGRSGNHRSEGLLIARGPGVPAGTKLEHGADILDLAPTALDLLGLEPTNRLIGKTIPLEERGDIPV
jgi:predicted AlkP superfamily phosphohydrolase/phosphomutase